MATMNLEMQLRLQDRMSAGMKAALKAMQDGTKNARREMDGLANAANRIKPTGIERMAKALREVKNLSKSVMDTLNKTAQAGAAIGAGAYVVKRALDKPMAYDLTLAHMTNTAYSGQSLASKRLAKASLNDTINNGMNGLVTRDQSAETLNAIFASGAINDPENAKKLLKPTTAAAAAANANPIDFASTATKSMQSFKIKESEISKIYDYMISGGIAGSFEAKDQARYLPGQMALAKKSGYSGAEDFKKLIAYNQASATATGDSDAAGINLTNLLDKINSVDTAKDVGKHFNIDLPKYLAENKAAGVDAVMAFTKLIDKDMEKNKSYQALQTALKTAKDGSEKQAVLESMVDIVEGSAMGKILQDRQASTAAVGIIGAQKTGYLDQVHSKMRLGVGDENLLFLKEQVSYSAGNLANQKDKAAYNFEQAIDGPLKSMLNGINSVAEANPVLAASAYAAATALGAIGASSGVSSILQGGAGAAVGGAVGGVVSGTVARVGLGAAGATAAAAAAPLAMPIAALGATGFLAYAAATKMGAGDLLDNTKLGEGIGQAIAIALAAFGNKEAKESLQINLHLDGKQISSTVQTRQTKEARRH